MWTVIAIAALFIGGYSLGDYLGWWGAAPGTASPTTYSFSVYDYATGNQTDETEDVQIGIYRTTVTDLDADEIEDLTYTDYTLDDNVTSGDVYTPDVDEDYLYMCLATGAGFQNEWFLPVLGENVIYMMNVTADASMLAFSSSGAFNTTVLNTAERTWTINMASLDAAEGPTAEKTTLEGYKTVYDFSDNTYDTVCIRIAFDDAAEASFVSILTDVEYTEVCVNSASANYTYLEIDATLLGDLAIEIKFSSDIAAYGDTDYGATEFHPQSIAIGYGNSGSFTAWDTQA